MVDPLTKEYKKLHQWKELGLEIDQLSAQFYLIDEKYHGHPICVGTNRERTLKKTSTEELFELQRKGLTCGECIEYLQFESGKNASVSFSALDTRMRQVSIAMNLKPLEKVSIKSIARGLSRARGATNAITMLEREGEVPGKNEMLSVLKAKLECFEAEMKTFRDSPEGIEKILLWIADQVFNLEEIGDRLPGKEDWDVDSKVLLKASKKLKKALRQNFLEYALAPVYSLCNNSNFADIIYPDGEVSSENASTLSGVQRLVKDKWFSDNSQIVVVPHMVARWFEEYDHYTTLQVVHLDEEPSPRTLECIKALCPPKYDEDGLTLRQIYDAALAID